MTTPAHCDKIRKVIEFWTRTDNVNSAESVSRVERIVEQTLLYDFYGELLTAHQQQIYEAAIFNDLSLSEIAQEQGISRQGVHDLIKRCNRILESYEEKLGLVARFTQVKQLADQLNRLTMQYTENRSEEVLENMTKTVREIVDTL